MKRKILILLMVMFLPFIRVDIHAEDYSDREAWDEKCNGESSAECDAYRAFLLEEKRNEMNEIKDNLEKLKEEMKANEAKLDDVKSMLDYLYSQMATLNVEIEELDSKIKVLEDDIKANEVLVEELNQRVMQRMRDSQETMHFNQYLDFLLGSSSFEDLMRRSYGIEAIVAKDEEDRNKLIDTIEKLDKDKKELDEKKSELDSKKQELEESEASYLEIQAYYEEEIEKLDAEIEELQNEYDNIAKDYSSILNQIGDITNIPSSAGLYSPAPGASISAGTWYYPASFGGGVHLGVDYAVKSGSNLYAPANGVVILSADGCPSTGYLGSGCGANIGGVYAGGNQVIMIVSAEDRVYGVSFFHLQQGSPVGTGVISEGDYVGRVGSSGNSSGPHCHIELYYLGEGDMSDIQNDYLLRDYTLGFNCGWGAYGLNRLCENGVGAPCRLRPELYFGT